MSTDPTDYTIDAAALARVFLILTDEIKRDGGRKLARENALANARTAITRELFGGDDSYDTIYRRVYWSNITSGATESDAGLAATNAAMLLNTDRQSS